MGKRNTKTRKKKSPNQPLKHPSKAFTNSDRFHITKKSILHPPYLFLSRRQCSQPPLDISTLYDEYQFPESFYGSNQIQNIKLSIKNNQFKSFGRQFLESFGWEFGTGLGKHLQGDPSIVKTRFKSNTNGLGGGKSFNHDLDILHSDFDSCFQTLKNQNDSCSDSSDSSDDSSDDSDPILIPFLKKSSSFAIHYQKKSSNKGGLGQNNSLSTMFL